MSIVVMRPGLLTTIQDRGRAGYRHLGIRPCGVMDPVAARVANLLVGNKDDAAVLEITLLGPTLHFKAPVLIALAGADFQATLDGQPILNNAPHWIDAGQTLELKQAGHGCRGYLAVEGGFNVPSILSSRSTDLRSGWGGFEGSALHTGDVLPLVKGWPLSEVWPGTQRSEGPGPFDGENTSVQMSKRAHAPTTWSVELPVLKTGSAGASPSHIQIPVVRGSEDTWFTHASWEALLNTPYTITPQSDRMGYRLQGEGLALESPRELLSAASLRGNLQVPADGQPILLMADHPTTGGYPVIATAAMAAWPALAQSKPGDQLQFVETTRAEARQMLVEQERALKKLTHAIELRIRS
jgi:antagonist of KipI